MYSKSPRWFAPEKTASFSGAGCVGVNDRLLVEAIASDKSVLKNRWLARRYNELFANMNGIQPKSIRFLERLSRVCKTLWLDGFSGGLNSVAQQLKIDLMLKVVPHLPPQKELQQLNIAFDPDAEDQMWSSQEWLVAKSEEIDKDLSILEKMCEVYPSEDNKSAASVARQRLTAVRISLSN